MNRPVQVTQFETTPDGERVVKIAHAGLNKPITVKVPRDMPLYLSREQVVSLNEFIRSIPIPSK